MLDEDIRVLARPDLCEDGSVDLAFQWELIRRRRLTGALTRYQESGSIRI